MAAAHELCDDEYCNAAIVTPECSKVSSMLIVLHNMTLKSYGKKSAGFLLPKIITIKISGHPHVKTPISLI